VELEQEDYDGWLPPPVAGELLKSAGGEVYTHILRESHATVASLQALMSGAPTDGYMIRASSPFVPANASRPRMYRCVRNLAPDKLAASDWIDLSLRTNTTINVYDEASRTPSIMQDVPYSPFALPFLEVLQDSSTFICRARTILSALSCASGLFPSRILPPLRPGMTCARKTARSGPDGCLPCSSSKELRCQAALSPESSPARA
jgi:hypothetical protein